MTFNISVIQFKRIKKTKENVANHAIKARFFNSFNKERKRMKYADWLNIWLENYIKPSAKPRTYTRYEQLVRAHIAPENRQHRSKRAYAHTFAVDRNAAFNRRQRENGQRLIGKHRERRYIGYAKLAENGSTARLRKGIHGKQRKTTET